MTTGHVRDCLEAVDSRFDKRYNDRKNVIGALRAVLDVLDAHGPDGMGSAGYDLWADVHGAILGHLEVHL